MDKGKVFAYIYEINSNEVKAYLASNTDSLIQSHIGGVSKIARIDSFVIISAANTRIVGVVKSLHVEPEKLYWLKTNNDYKDKQMIKTITISLLGQFYFDASGKKYFERGITVYPSIDEEVLIPTQEELNSILNNERKSKDNMIKIGNAYANPDIHVKLDPIKLFSHHCAILGSTGNGKSCTVSVILKELNKNGKQKIPTVLFDVNGEYAWALKNQNIKVLKFADKTTNDFPEEIVEKIDCVKIDFNSFSRRTWRNLLKPSEKTQVPAMNFAVDSLCLLGYKFSNIDISDLKTRNIDDRFIKYIEEKGDEIIGNDLCGDVSEKKPDLIKNAKFCVDFLIQLKKYSGKIINDAIRTVKVNILQLQKLICDRWSICPRTQGGTTVYEYNAFNYQNIGSLCDRIIEFARDEFFAQIFNTVSDDGMQLEEILDIKPNSNLILDLSSVSQECLPFVVDALLEKLLENALQNKYRKAPILLILDEAHHYLKQQSNDTESYIGATPGERIAKEGRKYGLHMLISTQRPGEISSTIMSQMGTLISHALINDKDKSILSSFGNYSDKELIAQLGILPRREAIVIGQAISTPIRIKVDYLDENNRPKSKDPLEDIFI